MAGRLATPTFDRRSYAFLVERLLPTHLLEPSRHGRLVRALAADDVASLRSESLAALLDLTAAGSFEERPAPWPGARLFARVDGGDQVLLEAPPAAEQQASRPRPVAPAQTVTQQPPDSQARAAPPVISSQIPEQAAENEDGLWEMEDGPGTAASARGAAGVEDRPTHAPRPPVARHPAIPDATREPAEGEAVPTAPPAVEAAWVEPNPPAAAGTIGSTAPEVSAWGDLGSFLELASIEPQLEPYGDRLRRVVAQLEASLPGAQVKLLCLDPDAADSIGNGAVEVLDRAAAAEIPHYRAALERGETQFATSAPVGADPASGRIAAALPVYVAGEPWGLLRVTWDRGGVASVPELARLLAPLSRLVAVAIQNQTMLEKLVFVDPLTGVYNRAFYDRQVSLEIERANRTNQKFALLVMDVDDFKPINDRYGHRAGDQVLAQLAREVRGRMRKIDLMFRYGGEEFVLLLPGADLEEAQRTAERLRVVVSEQRFLPEGVPAPLRVTVSVGGAVYPDQSRTKTGIFNAADTALYRAKHEGKNRACF
jgi:diguanylate cyclase (GGDEF)-like protein